MGKAKKRRTRRREPWWVRQLVDELQMSRYEAKEHRAALLVVGDRLVKLEARVAELEVVQQ